MGPRRGLVSAERGTISGNQFCRLVPLLQATGQGNLPAARVFTEQFIRSLDEGPTRDIFEGAFYWLDGKHEKAREVIATSYKTTKQPGTGLSLAVLLDEAGNADGRNKLLKELAADYKKMVPQLIEAIQFVLDTVLDPGATRRRSTPRNWSGGSRPVRCLSERPRRVLHRRVPQEPRPRRHGQAALRRCADSPTLWEWYRYIAKDALKSIKDK